MAMLSYHHSKNLTVIAQGPILVKPYRGPGPWKRTENWGCFAFPLNSLLPTTKHKADCKWTASRLLFKRQRGHCSEQRAPAFNPWPNRKCFGVATQLCSPAARTLGSLLTNDGQYSKPFERALQKPYSKNRSRARWERAIVYPWLKSGVRFMASSPSFPLLFPFSSIFLFLLHFTTHSLPVSVPPFLSAAFPPLAAHPLLPFLPFLSCKHLLPFPSLL